jgi:type II secretory pathway predicted ATPase ExeA
VAQAQENPVTEAKYLEFFELDRAPFTRLSTPSQIFDSAQYSLLMSHLASATEETDCLVVLRGADGSGKTTLLNRYLSHLDEDVFFATIDDSCRTATEFYSTFLRQLGFKDIMGTLKELRSITKEFLVHRASTGDTVLMVIDNAHLIRPVVLDQLHWIAAARVDDRRVLSVVIAGNSSISRIIESPALQELRFRSHIDFHIRVFSEEETAEYMRYRLEQAGNVDAVEIDEKAQALIYRFTGGNPGPINKLCNALLIECCEQETRTVGQEMVRTVASDLELLPHVVPLHDKGRRQSDKPEERITERESAPKKHKKKRAAKSALEITQLNEALAESRQALRESEKTRKAAIADLKKEQRALKNAQGISDKAKEKYQELDVMRSQLQASVKELKADLVTADKLGAELEAVEKQLADARSECESLQSQVTDIPELMQTIADKDARIAILTADLAKLTSESTATQALLPDQIDLPAKKSKKRKKDKKQKKQQKSNDEIAFFEIVHENKIKQVLKIDESVSRIMIGRDEDSDMQLDSEFVSRHHALMFCAGGFVRIEDLNSFNGTLVNLKKVNRTDLKVDDMIIIGDFQIHARRASD